ncbi:MAG TPA: CvpA family protein [Prolixibacteraceae bacterium]|nr:CvpA family protein [Prolixibacteraceae bacterium]
MNYIDLVLGIMLIIAAIQGFRKGFIIEFASLAALVLGIWGGIKFSDLTAGVITKYTGYSSEYLSTIAFFVTFIIIIILVHTMAKMLDNVVKAVFLGFLNRLAGIIFGVLKTAVILSVLLLLFDEVDETVHLLPTKQKQESQIYGPMKSVVPTLFPFIKLWKSDDSNNAEEEEPASKSKSVKS